MRRPRAALIAAVVIAAPILAASAGPRRSGGGAPHLAELDLVAIAPDGTAAMTRDLRGGLRLWPALDGSFEPVRVPVEAPARFALARHGSGLLVTVIDSANGAHVFSSVDGALTELAALPPTDPFADLRPLPGGALIGLAADSTLRLLSSSGKELARLEQRGFAPSQICVSPDGTALLAYEAVSDAFHRVKLDVAERTLTRHGDPVKLKVPEGAVRGQVPACSPDAKRWAVVATAQAGDRADVLVLDAETGETTRHEIPPSSPVSIPIFLDEQTLLFSPLAAGIPTWRLDLKTGRMTARANRGDSVRFAGAIAAARGRRIAAFAQWLLVDDVDADRLRYLGYETFAPASAEISPGKGRQRVVGWLISTAILIEPLDGKKGATLQIEEGVGARGFAFFDADHLIVLDSTGALRLIHWRSGRELTRTDTGIGWAQISYEPTSRLVHLNTGNEHRLYEVSPDKGFGPARVIYDLSWIGGLLAASKPTDAAFWTMDGAGKTRRYTLDELRRDLTWTEMRDHPTEPALPMTPTIVDGAGHAYVLRYEPAGAVVDVYAGKDPRTVHVGGTDVTLVVPSRDGKRLLVQRTFGVDAFDVAADKRLWGWAATNGVQSVSWSADGELVTIAAHMVGTTGAVLDANDGSVLVERCAGTFQARTSRPQFLPDDLNGDESAPAATMVCRL